MGSEQKLGIPADDGSCRHGVRILHEDRLAECLTLFIPFRLVCLSYQREQNHSSAKPVTVRSSPNGAARVTTAGTLQRRLEQLCDERPGMAGQTVASRRSLVDWKGCIGEAGSASLPGCRPGMGRGCKRCQANTTAQGIVSARTRWLLKRVGQCRDVSSGLLLLHVESSMFEYLVSVYRRSNHGQRCWRR
jgi:hypothetical protein